MNDNDRVYDLKEIEKRITKQLVCDAIENYMSICQNNEKDIFSEKLEKIRQLNNNDIDFITPFIIVEISTEDDKDLSPIVKYIKDRIFSPDYSF